MAGIEYKTPVVVVGTSYTDLWRDYTPSTVNYEDGLNLNRQRNHVTIDVQNLGSVALTGFNIQLKYTKNASYFDWLTDNEIREGDKQVLEVIGTPYTLAAGSHAQIRLDVPTAYQLQVQAKCGSTTNVKITGMVDPDFFFEEIGPSGLYGGASVLYNTVTTTPSAGELKTDNTTYSSCSEITAQIVDANGANVSDFFASFAVNDTIRLFDPDDSTSFGLFTIDAISLIDFSTRWFLEITFEAGTGDFGDTCVVSLSEKGDTGPTGPQGGYGGLSDNWEFSSTTTAPASDLGIIRFNNATYSSVTTVWVTDTDANSNDATTFLNQIASPHWGYFRFFQTSTPTNFATFEVTGVVAAPAGVNGYTVTYVDHNGTIGNGSDCVLSIQPYAFGRPASSTDNAIVRWSGATGRLIQDSSVLIADDDDVTIPAGSGLGIGAIADGSTYGLYLGDYTYNIFLSDAGGIWFRDSAVYIESTDDGHLDLHADTSIDINAPMTVGVDDTGYDVTMYGATSGKYLKWDESVNQLVIVGGALANRALSVTGRADIAGGIRTNIDNSAFDLSSYAISIQDNDTAYAYLQIRSSVTNDEGFFFGSEDTGSPAGNSAGVLYSTEGPTVFYSEADGSAGSYAIILTLFRESITIGSGVAGVDYALTFDGQTNDGTITWLEDEDYFQLDGGLDTQAIARQIVKIDDTDSPYTVLATDHVIICDASSGAITVNLPAAATITGRELSVKKIDSSGNAVTIDGNGAENIDGAATQVIAAQYDAPKIISDGTEWWVI